MVKKGIFGDVVDIFSSVGKPKGNRKRPEPKPEGHSKLIDFVGPATVVMKLASAPQGSDSYAPDPIMQVENLEDVCDQQSIDFQVQSDSDSYQDHVQETVEEQTEQKRVVIKDIGAFAKEMLKTVPKYSEEARIYRTLQYHDLISAAEKKYNIEPGLLYALIAHESNGFVDAINQGNEKCGGKGHSDGGAGLLMLQPGIAHALGIHTYQGADTSGADCVHGKKLKRLQREADGDIDLLARKDGRFNKEIIIDGGAKYFSSLYSKYKTWARALSAYNQGTPASNAPSTNYVRDNMGLKYDFVATIDSWKKGIVVDVPKDI